MISLYRDVRAPMARACPALQAVRLSMPDTTDAADLEDYFAAGWSFAAGAAALAVSLWCDLAH
jgi:hypothetical protein